MPAVWRCYYNHLGIGNFSRVFGGAMSVRHPFELQRGMSQIINLYCHKACCVLTVDSIKAYNRITNTVLLMALRNEGNREASVCQRMARKCACVHRCIC